MTDTVYRLDPRRFNEVAPMMARAFFDYPMWKWIMPDDEHRRRALPISSLATLLWGELIGETHAVGDPTQGVAVWARPGMAWAVASA